MSADPRPDESPSRTPRATTAHTAHVPRPSSASRDAGRFGSAAVSPRAGIRRHVAPRARTRRRTHRTPRLCRGWCARLAALALPHAWSVFVRVHVVQSTPFDLQVMQQTPRTRLLRPRQGGDVLVTDRNTGEPHAIHATWGSESTNGRRPTPGNAAGVPVRGRDPANDIPARRRRGTLAVQEREHKAGGLLRGQRRGQGRAHSLGGSGLPTHRFALAILGGARSLPPEVRAPEPPRLRRREAGLSERLHYFVRELALLERKAGRIVPGHPCADLLESVSSGG